MARLYGSSVVGEVASLSLHGRLLATVAGFASYVDRTQSISNQTRPATPSTSVEFKSQKSEVRSQLLVVNFSLCFPSLPHSLSD
jgi:hypothetical protein